MSISVEAPSGERLRGKRQVWCLLQVKLCDPCPSTLEWFVYHTRCYTSARIYLTLPYHPLGRSMMAKLWHMFLSKHCKLLPHVDSGIDPL